MTNETTEQKLARFNALFICDASDGDFASLRFLANELAARLKVCEGALDRIAKDPAINTFDDVEFTALEALTACDLTREFKG